MRKFLQVLFDHLASFVGNKPEQASLPEETDRDYLDTIQLALYKGSAVHVIYGNKSFTGDIVKLDEKRQRIILKNFKKNVTSIINFKDIQRVRLVPDGIKQSQTRE
ncbi:TPA: hypothetical protein U1606_001267 [Streptococcus suis]|nr:hypothetical protein [Streptococcus suis]HEM5457771.1 hypothetical protein [Streptococcus suis]